MTLRTNSCSIKSTFAPAQVKCNSGGGIIGCHQFEFHASVMVVVVVVPGGLYCELKVWVTKVQWDLVKLSTSPHIGTHILY